MSQNAYTAPNGPQGQISWSGTDVGIPASTTLGSSATATGTLTASRGVRELAVSGTSTHAGTLTLTTYLDAAGTVVGETVNGSLSANTALTIYASANKPFAAFKVSITDTSGSAGTCVVNSVLGQF